VRVWAVVLFHLKQQPTMFIHAEKQLTEDELAEQDKQMSLIKANSQLSLDAFREQVATYSKPRKLVYTVVESKAYGAIMLGVIVVYSILMAFYEPLKEDDSGANWLIKQTEAVFTLIFLFDVLMQLGHSGPKRFFTGKDRWWNLLDVFVVGAGLISFLPGSDSSLGMLRTLRVLRPLRSLNKVESVKHVVVALGTSIPGLANVFALVLFVIFIYALFGVKLWVGTLEGRCALPYGEPGESSGRHCDIWKVADGTNPDGIAAADTCIDRSDRLEPGKFTFPESGMCCAPEKCFASTNPDGGFTGFNNIGMAILTVFNTMTLEGWSGTVFALTQAQGGALVYIYFMTLLVLGGLLVTNYLLAECCVVFGMHMENLRIAKEFQDEMKRMEAIAKMADGVAATESDVTELTDTKAFPADDLEAKASETVPLLEQQPAVGEKPGDAELEPRRPVRRTCWQSLQVCRKSWGEKAAVKKAFSCVESPAVQSALTGAIMVNFILLGLEHHEMDPDFAKWLNYGNLVLTGVFTIEMLVKQFALGLLGYFSDAFNAYDAVIVVSSLAEVALDGKGSVSILRTLRVFRIARSFKLIKSGSSLRFVLETALASLAAVASFGGLLLLMIYIYTLIGMNIFGGLLQSVDGDDVMDEVPRANYDTFLTGFLSVFQVATRENWTSLLFDGMSAKGLSPMAAVVFYISLVLLTNYILLALFMGTLLENFQKEFQKERDRTKPKLDINSITFIARAKHKFMKNALRVRAHPEQVRKSHACLVFSNTGCFRKSCVRISNATWFENSVMTAIFVSSLLLALEHPNDVPGTTRYEVLKWFDIILTAFFTAEMLVKMVAQGLVLGPRAYIRDGWHVLDFFVVVTSIANLAVTSESMKYLRVLRAVRVLKSIQHMKRYPNLQVVVSSLIFSMPSIITVCGLGLFFTLIMAILFQQLFGGSLYACTDPDESVKLMCIGAFSDGTEMRERVWQNNPRNYDNVLSSLLVMLELLTIEDWNSIMASAIDATDPHHGPIRDNNPGWGLLFMIYIVLGSFFVMNLFVGVIVTAYNDAKNEADQGLGAVGNQEARRTKRIRETHDTALYAYHQTRNQTSKGWRGPFIKLMFHPNFDHFVMFTIILNIVAMCMEYGSWIGADMGLGCGDAESTGMVESAIAAACATQSDGKCLYNPINGHCEPDWSQQALREVPGMSAEILDFTAVASEIFAYIFTFEMVVKILALGLNKWYESLWNRFDCLIVCTSLLEIILLKISADSDINPSMFRIFRICRVVRFVRVSEKAKGIKNLVETFTETLPYLLNVFVVMLIFVFIYAVVGVSLFSNIIKQEVLGDDLNFSTFSKAVVTLLLIASGENWTDLMRSCMVTEPDCNQPGTWTVTDDGQLIDSWGRDLSSVYDEPIDDCGQPYLAPLFFMSFMILTTYVSLNIMVAVILLTFFDIEGAPTAKMLDEQRVEKFMEATQSSEIDYDQNGMVEISQLEKFLTRVGSPLGIEGTLAISLEDDFVDFMKGHVFHEHGVKKRAEKTGLNYHMAQVAKTRRRLVIHGAKDVADADGMGASDPYAIVWWNGRQVGKTNPVFETLNPVWDEDFAVDLAENSGTNYLRIEIYDQDNADSDDFLGQVEVALPGGRSDDAFMNRAYRLGRQLGHSLPVTPAGERRSLFSRCKRAQVSDSVDIGDEGVKGTLTISLKKEIWVDGDGEAEVDREELLRFCIKRKYDVDVRPPKEEKKEGLVASAGRLAGMAFTMPTLKNTAAVSPDADGDDDSRPQLTAAQSFKRSLSVKNTNAANAAREDSTLAQLRKLTPRDEDEGVASVGAGSLKTSPRQPRVEFSGDAQPLPPPGDTSEPASSSPPAPPEAGGGGPGPRKPRVQFNAGDPPTPRSATVSFLNGLDCDEVERAISPDKDEEQQQQQQPPQDGELPGLMP
jgi:hypothetical protein